MNQTIGLNRLRRICNYINGFTCLLIFWISCLNIHSTFPLHYFWFGVFNATAIIIWIFNCQKISCSLLMFHGRQLKHFWRCSERMIELLMCLLYCKLWGIWLLMINSYRNIFQASFELLQIHFYVLWKF